MKQGLSICIFVPSTVFKDNNVENINSPFSTCHGDPEPGKAANPQGPSGYGLQPRGWNSQINERKGGNYKGGSPEPLSKEAVWGCCVGVGDELHLSDLSCTSAVKGRLESFGATSQVGANEETCSSSQF